MCQKPFIKPSARRVPKVGIPESRLITDAVFIAGITAVAYVFSFLFEMGYCRHFGIPFYLIAATPSAVIFAVLIIAMALSIGSDVYGFTAFIFEELKLSRLGFRVFQWVIYSMLGVALYGRTEDAIVTSMLAAIMVFTPYLMALPSNKAPLIERLWAAEKIPNPFVQIDPVARTLVRWGPASVRAFNFCVIGCAISFGLGAAYARIQTDFVELSNIPNSLLVKTYGELMVAVKFDPTTKTATGETLILKYGEAATIMRVKTKVGPINRPVALLLR